MDVVVDRIHPPRHLPLSRLEHMPVVFDVRTIEEWLRSCIAFPR